LANTKQKKTLFTLKLPADQRTKLHEAAATRGISTAELIRRGLKSQGVEITP
jgi:hypothetical protein